MQHFISFFLKFKSDLLVKRVFVLLNASFAMEILDLISRVHLPSFVNMLPKYLKHSTSSMIKLNILTSGSASFDADQNRISYFVIFHNSNIKIHITIILPLLL